MPDVQPIIDHIKRGEAKPFATTYKPGSGTLFTLKKELDAAGIRYNIYMGLYEDLFLPVLDNGEARVVEADILSDTEAWLIAEMPTREQADLLAERLHGRHNRTIILVPETK